MHLFKFSAKYRKSLVIEQKEVYKNVHTYYVEEQR